MATDPAEKRLKAVTPLLVKLREQLAGVYQTMDEVLQTVGGEASFHDVMKTLSKHFETVWSARYGHSQYAWQYAKDRPQMKRLLRLMNAEEVQARMTRYLQNNDAFFTKNRHTFGLFVSTINQHAEEQHTAEFEVSDTRPMGCRHEPACRDDVAHTRKAQDERRASL